MAPNNEVNTIEYYGLDTINKGQIQDYIRSAVNSLTDNTMNNNMDPKEFVIQIFDKRPLVELLIHLSRLPVFDKEFASSMNYDLEMLATVKKLKYYNNLPIAQNLQLIQQLMLSYGVENQDYDKAYFHLVKKAGKFAATRLNDYIRQNASLMINGSTYIDNMATLEKIDPHAVYPTSIYRHCDGLTLASKDSKSIEAVMSTTLTTSIKITNNALDFGNKNLINVYLPLGRCVAIIDDKVIQHYGEKLQAYFDHYGVELIKLIHGGDEIDKDIKNVEKILVELKQKGVSRHEPVLIMGGGVIADIGGFATALYHRNTPYVMLCTSIVTGIDAGPSPRTCCDGFGFKNLYGAYHPPILTLTDRSFFRSLHEGWLRHGIAEIIKMAVVKDKSLFELLEKAGPRLITTKFGTVGDTDAEFEETCDLIIGKAMEGYVRSEYGNLWETHQCRPHAYGHTWSPGYELPAGMLHGHAVATCMGYGAYLARLEGFITESEQMRILKLISNMELSLWHDIMENHDLVAAANKKVVEKRGGNLCAPVPKQLGKCGYINDLSREKLDTTLDEYKNICSSFPRGGRGIDVHCRDVGLQDPSTVAGDAYQGISKVIATTTTKDATKPGSYAEWIKNVQTERNNEWEMNVTFESAPDTECPPEYHNFKLFHDGVEKYAMSQTTVASKDMQYIAGLTENNAMFSPCMVGTLESQFLKMQCQIKGAKTCLDVGTFTGMSALAFAEGIPDDGKVVTLECYEDIAKVAQKAFDASSVGHKINLRLGTAIESMKQLAIEGHKFDIIFLDADKENYQAYYDIALDEGLLADNGIIMADNVLCALLYDKTDFRSQKLHEFNQYVKNDPRVEQVQLTIREGISIIRRV